MTRRVVVHIPTGQRPITLFNHDVDEFMVLQHNHTMLFNNIIWVYNILGLNGRSLPILYYFYLGRFLPLFCGVERVAATFKAMSSYVLVSISSTLFLWLQNTLTFKYNSNINEPTLMIIIIPYSKYMQVRYCIMFAVSHQIVFVICCVTHLMILNFALI